MQDKLEIFIFKKARICSNANHRISFENDDDIYNPFSMKNVAFSFNQCLDTYEDVFADVYEIAIQLSLSSNLRYVHLNNIEKKFRRCMFDVVKDIVKHNKIALLSSNIPYHCACMKFMLHLAKN